ncbi:hypothetical protein CspHIS471_0408930 [Cutaneotrichosporon sp. HIS471]|nr:hypothetical protein CspHIS471_0408930 [Cutaneotrichosporon sp. HIS471]
MAAVVLLSLLSGAAAQAIAPSITANIRPDIPSMPVHTVEGYQIPALKEITKDAPSSKTVAMYSTGLPGATPTISGAPVIPTAPSYLNYPELDKIPATNSPQVQKWMSEINWALVPNLTVTDGTCAGSPAAANDPSRCWWTCGGCTRKTDIAECPDQYTWGISFDDGPSPYTPLLLDYLEEKNIKSTFFLVGSRVISYPSMVVTEYLAGHQLSIHTWSHPSLTKLSNEEIVAELGWTKQAIHDVVGVTPNTFRPPYGDIDDRVRGIAAQMGLTPVMWTRHNGKTLDTTDWNIPGGQASGETAVSRFQDILDTVPQLDTGFIVLQHDLYQQTVDLAVGYFLPMAVASGKYAMKSIIECLGLPNSEGYIETSANVTATQIPGSGTVFQPKVGTQTGVAPEITTGKSANGAAATDSKSGSPAGASVTPKSGATKSYASAAIALAAVLATIAFSA